MNSLKPTNEWFSGAQLGENRPDGLKEEMEWNKIVQFFWKVPPMWAYKITITILEPWFSSYYVRLNGLIMGNAEFIIIYLL